MTLNNKRKALYILLMLPPILLGAAALGVGLMRSWAEFNGIETPSDTVSGPGMLGLSLIPLGTAALVLFFALRSRHALPPPPMEQLAPGAATGDGRYDFDRVLLERVLERLGMSMENPGAETRLSIVCRDSWSFGILLIVVAAGLAVFIGWPSLRAGQLALAPPDTVPLIFYLWVSGFLVLAAMPVSPRRLLIQPTRDALHLEIGPGRRTFGLSRLVGLESRVQVAVRRDGETQAVNSKSFRSQLIGWFNVEQRGPVPFVLLWGASVHTLDDSDEQLEQIGALARELARGLGVGVGPPPRSDGEPTRRENEPYE